MHTEDLATGALSQNPVTGAYSVALYVPEFDRYLIVKDGLITRADIRDYCAKHLIHIASLDEDGGVS